MSSSAWLIGSAYHFVADCNVFEAGVWMLRYRVDPQPKEKSKRWSNDNSYYFTRHNRRTAQRTRSDWA